VVEGRKVEGLGIFFRASSIRDSQFVSNIMNNFILARSLFAHRDRGRGKVTDSFLFFWSKRKESYKRREICTNCEKEESDPHLFEDQSVFAFFSCGYTPKRPTSVPSHQERWEKDQCVRTSDSVGAPNRAARFFFFSSSSCNL